MTPNELQERVVAGIAAPLVDALAPLDEKTRRMLAKRAFELYQAANEFERKSELGQLMGDAGRPACRNAELAVLGCCDGSKARRLQLIFNFEAELPQQMLAVLLARRPAWIDGWIKHLIDKKWIRGNWWPLVRGLVRAGVASKPAPHLYINLMVNGLGWRNWHKDAPQVPLSRLLLEDPDLLETEIWQLFETEHKGFAADRFMAQRENHETWTVALIRLAREGHVDRARLIDASLNGMASGLKPLAIGAFVDFAAALEISVEELSRRQPILCQLLANQTGTAVSFALEGLNRLEKAQLLERDSLLDAIEPALLFPKKSQANSAVALLKLLAKNDAVRRSRCLLAAVRALSHASEDVQRRATELIEAYPVDSNPLLRQAIGAQIESMALTVRDRLSALSTSVDEPKEVAAPVDRVALHARLARLPATMVERWGLKPAIEGLAAGTGVEMGRKVPADEADYRRVVPIASPDELLEAIALAVESVSCADEVERLIDGVARFADRRPDSKVADTIFQRFLKPTSAKGLTSSLGVPPQLVQLMGMWFGVEVKTGNGFGESASWWTVRFEPYLTALRQRRAWQPLSTPTHAGGWIDPRIWVARLNASAGSISDSDAIQSLLRLAPFGRDEALRSVGKMPGPWRRVAEYALGGDCSLGVTDLFRSSLWIAAGRARQPTGELKELHTLVGVTNVPDAIRESRFNLEQKVVHGGYRPWNSESTFLPLEASFDADVRKKSDDIPQCMFYPKKATGTYSLEWTGPWVIEWKSQIWPMNLRGFLYWGINRMLQRFEASSSVYEPNHVYVDSLRPPQRALGDVEYMALAIGCMSAEQEVRRSAVEILIRASIEGRLAPAPFAAALQELYTKGWFSMGRLATTLGVAARDSPQSAKRVVDTLVAFLMYVEDLPQGSHEVLNVLYQQSHRLGITAPEPLKKRLAGQQGKTRTAQLARDLLGLEESAMRAAAAGREAIERLLERAELEARECNSSC